MKGDFQFEQIDESNFDKYEFLILPDIADAVRISMAPYIIYGASIDGAAVGAIVAEMDEDCDIDIVSLYVAAAFRNKGIGRSLIERVLTATAYLYENELEFDGQDSDEKGIFGVYAYYALPGSGIQDLEGFLKAVGFGDFVEISQIHTFDTEKVLRRMEDLPVDGAKSLVDCDEHYLEGLDIYLFDEETGEKTDLVDKEFSFMTEPDEDGASGFFVLETSDRYFFIERCLGRAGHSSRELMACIKASLLAITESRGCNCKLMYEFIKNDQSDFIKSIFGSPEKVTYRHAAEMDVEITGFSDKEG